MHIFKKSQGIIVMWVLFLQSYYIAKFKNGQNYCLGCSSVKGENLLETNACKVYLLTKFVD